MHCFEHFTHAGFFVVSDAQMTELILYGVGTVMCCREHWIFTHYLGETQTIMRYNVSTWYEVVIESLASHKARHVPHNGLCGTVYLTYT